MDAPSSSSAPATADHGGGRGQQAPPSSSSAPPVQGGQNKNAANVPTTTTRPSLHCISTLAPPPPPGLLSQAAAAFLPPRAAVSSSGATAWQVAWNRDGRLLACCYGAPDACVRIWRRRPRGGGGTTTAPTGEGEGDGDDDAIGKADAEEGGVRKGFGEEGGVGGGWVLCATLRGVHERTVRSVAFAPFGNVLASASFDGTVAIWEDLSNERLEDKTEEGFFGEDDDDAGGWECTAQLEGHENEVKCVTWNSTGTLLASCGRDKSVWIWESLLPGMIGGPDPDPDGGGGGGEAEFECVAVLHGHSGDVKCVEFAPSHDQWGDGDEILLSASYDDTIKCWAEDGGDWYCAATLSNVHSSTVWSIATAPGGARFVSASDDCSLGIWKCYTSEERARMFPDAEGSSSTGLWKCVGKLPSAHDRTIYSVHYAPSNAGHGRIASSGADDCINIYREVGGFGTTNSDQPKFALDATEHSAHDGDVNCIRWHPRDGTVLASAGDDGCVRLWRYFA